jgi:pimeloyl-ACP methyl ester carboxylesterase
VLSIRGGIIAGTLRPVGIELPELRTVDLDGPVRYREWDGPPDTTFVLVHGLGGSHLNWSLVAPGLAGLGRVLALDLPGFGSSPRAGRGSGLMDQRRALSAFTRELAGGHVILAGNSMGGATAMLEAAVNPDAVDGLVLTCSIFPWARGGRPHPLILSAFALYRSPAVGEWLADRRYRSLDPEQAVRMSFRLVAADPASVPEDLVRRIAEQVTERRADPDAGAAFLDAARSMLRLGARPAIAARAMDNVRCPVLVLHGRRDRLVPAAFAEAALRSHPAWRGRIFPDLGHVPQIEAPGRWLAEVADWFADV